MSNITEQLTLTEFLTAMLNQDAAAWQHSSEFLAAQPHLAYLSWYMLADIEAKRAIVKWCGGRDQIWVGTISSDPELPSPEDFVPGHLKNPAGSMVLRLLAAVYSDHPDYREEWKP